MNKSVMVVRNGYDGEKCFVHARSCFAPWSAVMTAQYLDVSGCDVFSGIYMSVSRDDGNTWSDLKEQNNLRSLPRADGRRTVCCDGTPMYHKHTDTVVLLGHTANYKADEKSLDRDVHRQCFYSVLKNGEAEFSEPKFLSVPENITSFGNGCGQSIELENGEMLIPGYYKDQVGNCVSVVVRCAFDGENITVIEAGNSLTVNAPRGLGEPSIVKHKDTYYMTLRNDVCAYVAKSSDGVHYTSLQPWCWDDGELLPNYNTQQHWMTLGEKLYLVYTRRYANNDHVFRHRAPLFAAEVEDMRVIRESEISVIEQRGARLGNFGVTNKADGSAVITAAEWMQPKGCEKYGSDNSIFLAVIKERQ